MLLALSLEKSQVKTCHCYALVLKDPNLPPLPVAEMLTTKHTGLNIKHFIERFLLNIGNSFSKFHCSRVEVNFSWTMIHGCIEAFDKITFLSYLEKAWQYCEDGDESTEK